MKLTKTICLIVTALVLLFTTIGCAAPGIQNSEVPTGAVDFLQTGGNGDVPAVVGEQLAASKANIDKYLQGTLQIESVEVVGELANGRSAVAAHDLVADEKSVIAFGNIMQPETVNIGAMSTLYSNEELAEVRGTVRSGAEKGIKAGSKVLEITWKSGDKTFKTNCYYDDTGIVWDNVLTGLIMMNPEAQTYVTSSTSRATSWKSHKSWWTANWLWGSKRGEMGYKIKIYYSGRSVRSTDISDWGYISIGNAKSYSKVTKNSGSYGKGQYALGLSTPTVSLSFSHKTFKVSSSGIGSKMIANGTKTLFP